MPGKHNAGGCRCCDCECTFLAAFSYDLPGRECLLTFIVSNLQDACTVIDVESATITIVLKCNGTTITEPLIYDTVNNIIYWERWKPTAGDVYTADVELNCGGSTFSQSYSYTIPTPANTDCVCCTERIPDYLVISGGSGCCDMDNGTWALTDAGGSCAAGTRHYSYSDNDIYSAPASPCSGGECYSVVDGSDTYYLWKRGVLFDVILPASAGPDNITINITNVYRAYRLRSGTCDLFSSNFAVTHTYTLSCDGGDAGTPTGGSALVGAGSTYAVPCASGPTVQLFIA